MTHLFLRVSGAVLLVAGCGLAQQGAAGQLHPVTSDVKYGGTYHVASNSWLRGVSNLEASGPGMDVLYDNACQIDFFFAPAEGETVVDSGRIPSTSSPSSSVSLTGDSDSYVITGMQYSYCTGESPTIDIGISHIACYSPCDSAVGLPTVSSLTIPGAPGSPFAGSISCWIIDVDLRNSLLEFELAADCSGAYDDSPVTDNFGWSMLFLTPPVNGP